MAFYHWSQTAASNGTADPTVNFAEGQAPSSVNDSNRAAMAALRKWGDDISGTLVTGGSSTAYTVTSNSSYDSLAHLNGQIVAFTPHTTNTAASPTLNVDSLGAKTICTAPSTPVQSGVLIQGTPYVALYNNSDGVFYLFGVGSAPTIPLLVGMDYWDTTTPGSAWIFPAGQAISRTTYSAAFAKWGTTYGSGDGSTTFNVPDKTGRVSAMKESSATRLTSTYFGGNSTNLGATGGGESQTLTLAQLPTGITASVTATGTASNFQVDGSSVNFQYLSPASTGQDFTTGNKVIRNGTQATASVSVTGTATSNNTSGNAHPNVQPTIVCNYIIRII